MNLNKREWWITRKTKKSDRVLRERKHFFIYSNTRLSIKNEFDISINKLANDWRDAMSTVNDEFLFKNTFYTRKW